VSLIKDPLHEEKKKGRAHSRHFGKNHLHPIVTFTSDEDYLAVELRAGNVHSADQWRAIVDREQHKTQNEMKRGGCAWSPARRYHSTRKGFSGTPMTGPKPPHKNWPRC